MKQLVRLWKRPSRDGLSFVFVLDYKDEQDKRRQISLGHADRRKAERQRDQKDRELRMGFVEPDSMRLSKFLEDSQRRTGKQVRQSTLEESASIMRDFIKAIGNMDYQQIQHEHGERYIRVCQDNGNSPATVDKKLRHLKRFFQLAVHRGQLETNPLRWVKGPKVPRKKINTFSMAECERIIRAAQQSKSEFRWDLIIMLALTTGLRRGELLNLTWTDIDFENGTITITSKKNTPHTWEWQIKDADQRTLAIPNDLLLSLAEHQDKQPVGYPYVFVPPARYDFIQQLRANGQWTYSCSRLKVIQNFTRDFWLLLQRASVPRAKFHDLRRTALTVWLRNGLREHEVMTLAGHASFATTRAFYLAVGEDLADKTRKVTCEVFGNLLRACCAPPFSADTKKADNCNQLPAKNLSNGQGRS